MNEELEARIDEKEEWTFKECLGLAADFNLKTRIVIAMVLARGKNYSDGDGMQRLDGNNNE